MESIKIKKRARTIPFGFKQSQDPEYLEPVKEELDALRQAREYSKTCSLRETAQWLHRKTGRYISHVGLRKALVRKLQRQNKHYVLLKCLQKIQKRNC
jgi:hypothetical protein